MYDVDFRVNKKETYFSGSIEILRHQIQEEAIKRLKWGNILRYMADGIVWNSLGIGNNDFSSDIYN